MYTRLRSLGFAAAVATITLTPGAVMGQTLYNTFGPAESFNSSIPGASAGAGLLGGFSPQEGGITLAEAFTPAVTANLSRVDLGMEYIYGGKTIGPADLNVTIASDQSGSPGEPIETISLTGVFGGVPNAIGIVTAYSVLHPLLTAGTQYWLVVAPPNLQATTFDWFLNYQVHIPTASGLSGGFGPVVSNVATVFAVFGGQNTGLRPGIAEGGVLDAASFRPAISPGSWFSIFGTNLSPITRNWEASDFVNGALPFSLSGVAVQFGGVPAAVSYISPGQINAQVPDGIGPGAVTVQVITPAGTSTLAQVTAGAISPGFFTFGSGGTTYIVATFADGTIVGPPGMLGSAVATRPAKPGDVITLWGSGFGATTPSVSAGMLFSGAAPLATSDQLAVTTGNQPTPVEFAGLSGAGLYQFNVTVPELPDGNQPVLAQINVSGQSGGTSTQQPLYLTIQH